MDYGQFHSSIEGLLIIAIGMIFIGSSFHYRLFAIQAITQGRTDIALARHLSILKGAGLIALGIVYIYMH